MIDQSASEAEVPAPSSPPSRRRVRASADGRTRRRRIITWALFVGCTVLMVNAVIGENGYLATVRAHRQTDAIHTDIARLRNENQQLLEQVRRLKADPAALEEEARKALGLIRPGEKLIIVHDAKPAPPATAPADPAGQGK